MSGVLVQDLTRSVIVIVGLYGHMGSCRAKMGSRLVYLQGSKWFYLLGSEWVKLIVPHCLNDVSCLYSEIVYFSLLKKLYLHNLAFLDT